MQNRAGSSPAFGTNTLGENVLEQYFPILIFLLIGAALGIAPIVLAWIVSLKRPDAQKLAPYECGFKEFEDARLPFDVRFYLVAILFILFDLETAFFIPWSVVLRKIGSPGFWGMMIFLTLLVVGFVYEWKRGALEWE